MKHFVQGFLFTLLFALVLLPQHSQAQKLKSGPQVLTFFSDADDTDQPYGLYLPKNYDENKKYPLVIMLHGAGSNHRLDLRRVFGKSNQNEETDVEATRYFPAWDDVDFIVAAPLARGTIGYQGIPEQDVYDVLDDVQKRFQIDENRIYLTGLSMGGGGTLWIGLTRPDIWAAIAPVCPAPPEGTFDLASNALNFPIHFFHGDADPVVPVAGTRKWVEHLQQIGAEVSYKEFVDVKHDSWVSAYDNEFIFEWFSHAVRDPHPDRVFFSAKQYKYNKAYWVTFDKIVQGAVAKIEARITSGNIITITSENLNAFTLNLKGHPKFKAGSTLTLKVDGATLTAKTDSTVSFNKAGSAWRVGKVSATEELVKKKGAEGPIFDAFSSRHIYVYGTAGNPSPEELKKRMTTASQAADWAYYRGTFPGRVMFFPRVVADKDVRPSDLESCNLILFGTKEDNLLINKYAAQLPMHLNAGAGDYGLFYVFPVGTHYVAINSGLPWWSGDQSHDYPFMPVNHRKLAGYKDYILFKDNASNVVADGYFTEQWKVTPEAQQKLSGAVNFNK
ncbi:carboxylesterase family protein [Dyadobacter sandarakinus]|uniref:Prolyl oligopeptidase family serine peptidase n=1 Tax=Dyadobacter sandarakinus TaxID=2747268 RepID=A0ABX7I6L6_9BACT|nr:prolyl oligopeptidase family serine peptidase [Dyadobacter sandarakinus]QRR01744.1 prolyl oligopeptidase family serine peptidase [Dyadobacter sandarakinus]